MRILMLGGTSFVGRHIAADALARGHELTLFTRGRTGPDLFPEAARLTGDRASGDYAQVSASSGSWDAVVDVSAYVPRHVAQAAEAVGDVARYLFISTVSVYDLAKAAEDRTEDAGRLAPVRDTEEVTGATYGGLKVACEDDVSARYGGHATVVRPGVVAGPHDESDRFTYWVRRAAEGGAVDLPGDPEQPVQVVDARDLARLVTALLEADRPGTYDAVGPAEPVTMRQLVETCARAAGTTVTLQPRTGGTGPLLLDRPDRYPMFLRSRARAEAAGLPATPLLQTAADTLAWDRERGLPDLSVGVS